jgi:hypothetical protein
VISEKLEDVWSGDVVVVAAFLGESLLLEATAWEGEMPEEWVVVFDLLGEDCASMVWWLVVSLFSAWSFLLKPSTYCSVLTGPMKQTAPRSSSTWWSAKLQPSHKLQPVYFYIIWCVEVA